MAKAKNLQTSENQMIDQVVDIIKFMGENKLAEIELETSELKLSLKKHSPVHIHTVHAPVASMAMPVTESVKPLSKAAPVVQSEKNTASETKNNYKTLVSPMTGTFYRSPSPDSQPFVKEGDVVKPGQTMCIVEAMKMMNEIKSDKAGKIIKILIENGQSVEKGTTLIYIEE
ncbi:MAG: acetyl-CoA carboxylase biotin carboxyl carrier protein [Erysipelotrichia bacterium]|nr:acetyl-CoA carboxylase biotin carboxyl carrier protein [Erysipelotrichia bacterium]